MNRDERAFEILKYRKRLMESRTQGPSSERSSTTNCTHAYSYCSLPHLLLWTVPQLSTSRPLSTTCTHTTDTKLLFNISSTYYRILVTCNRLYNIVYPDPSVSNCRDGSVILLWYKRVLHTCNNRNDIWFLLWNIFLMIINYVVDWTCIKALLGWGSVDLTELPIN